MHRDFRKPLIVMTPKSLLRHKLCTSTLEEMGPDSSFHRVMYDKPPSDADQAVTRAVLCSGKVYYDLAQRRTELGLEDSVALLRLEQLAPFPRKVLAEELDRYPKSIEVVWCQEEPQNMGAWSFVAARIETVLDELGFTLSGPGYAGRAAAASTATGSHQQHVREQGILVDAALQGERGHEGRAVKASAA
jgi:2-oxoglutarate dehydrogenase E1 component